MQEQFPFSPPIPIFIGVSPVLGRFFKTTLAHFFGGEKIRCFMHFAPSLSFWILGTPCLHASSERLVSISCGRQTMTQKQAALARSRFSRTMMRSSLWMLFAILSALSVFEAGNKQLGPSRMECGGHQRRGRSGQRGHQGGPDLHQVPPLLCLYTPAVFVFYI
jgi:hypothetical protein